MTTAVDDAELGVPHPTVRAAAFALLSGFALLMLANGIQSTLVGVRAELEHFGNLWVGAIMAAYFAGFLAGTQLASTYLGRVGHIRTYAALASLASTSAIMHVVAINPPTWLMLRFMTGLCMAGIYVTVESWLNDIANSKIDGVSIRGRLLAAYMIITMGALSLSQVVFQFASPLNIGLFVLATVLASLSLVPTALSTTSAPVVQFPEPMSIRDLARTVPTGVVTAFLLGMAVGILLGLAPVYATREGLSGGQLSWFVAAPTVGAMLGQWPLGSLSDRISRRTVMLGAAAASTVASVALSQTPADSPATTALLVVLGAALFPIYSLALAYVNDWIAPHQMLGASVAYVRINGLGAFAGPVLATAVMSVWGAGMFFWLLAGLNGLIAAYITYRVAIRDAMPVDDQRPWVPVATRGGVVVASTLSKPRRALRVPVARRKPKKTSDV